MRVEAQIQYNIRAIPKEGVGIVETFANTYPEAKKTFWQYVADYKYRDGYTDIEWEMQWREKEEGEEWKIDITWHRVTVKKVNLADVRMVQDMIIDHAILEDFHRKGGKWVKSKTDKPIR